MTMRELTDIRSIRDTADKKTCVVREPRDLMEQIDSKGMD